MKSKFRVYDVTNGLTVAVISVAGTPNGETRIEASVLPEFRKLNTNGTKMKPDRLTAVRFPVGTTDDYIIRDLLSCIGIAGSAVGTRFKYEKEVA